MSRNIFFSLFSLYAAIYSFRLAYQGIVQKNVKGGSNFHELLNIPQKYYMGKRAIRSGIGELIGGCGFLALAIYYFSDERLKFFGIIFILSIAIIIIIGFLTLIFDPPWKLKNDTKTGPPEAH